MAGSSGRRRPLIVIGVLLIVVGLVAGAALWIGSTNRRNAAIADLARAPVGCDTTLDFVESGEYLVFIESEGELEEVRGDCGATGAYDISTARADAAASDIAVVDPDGEAVDLDPVDGSEANYDENGFVGRAAFRLDVADAADHVVRVGSTDDAFFAVAIGRDPSDGVAALRIGGIVAALAGLAFGILLILLGSRRRSPAPSGGPPQWQPGSAPPPPPHQPPMGPPVYGQPQGPPSYGGSAGTAPPHPRTPPPPPPEPAAGGPSQWQPPSPPGAPRIPGEPDLIPGPPSIDDDDAIPQERPARDDRWPLPPPE